MCILWLPNEFKEKTKRYKQNLTLSTPSPAPLGLGDRPVPGLLVGVGGGGGLFHPHYFSEKRSKSLKGGMTKHFESCNIVQYNFNANNKFKIHYVRGLTLTNTETIAEQIHNTV